MLPNRKVGYLSLILKVHELNVALMEQKTPLRREIISTSLALLRSNNLDLALKPTCVKQVPALRGFLPLVVWFRKTVSLSRGFVDLSIIFTE
jgi:hypothetical protein